jgi:hypothetical protein
VSQQNSFEKYPQHTDFVYAFMFVKTDIFGRDQGFDGIRGNMIEIDIGTVFDIIFTDQQVVFAIQFRSFVITDIPQFGIIR